jgi:hypothetical protein
MVAMQLPPAQGVSNAACRFKGAHWHALTGLQILHWSTPSLNCNLPVQIPRPKADISGGACSITHLAPHFRRMAHPARAQRELSAWCNTKLRECGLDSLAVAIQELTVCNQITAVRKPDCSAQMPVAARGAAGRGARVSICTEREAR